MSGDEAIHSESTLELKPTVQIEFSDYDINNNPCIPSLKGAVGGTSEEKLIADETPPDSVLQLNSDPDLMSDIDTKEKTNVIITEMDENPKKSETEPSPERPEPKNSSEISPEKAEPQIEPLSPHHVQDDNNLNVTDAPILSKVPLQLSQTHFETIDTASQDIDEDYTDIKYEDHPSERSRLTDQLPQLTNPPGEVIAPEAEVSGAVPTWNDSSSHISSGVESSCLSDCESNGESGPASQNRNELIISQSSKTGKKRSPTKTRNSSKSLVRLVEVCERKSATVKSKDGKPLSPYLCKIFPVPDKPKAKKSSSTSKSRVVSSPSKSTKFVVDTRQNRMLDQQLTQAVESERLHLLELMTEYFRRKQVKSTIDTVMTGCGSPSSETYMSWIMEDKHKTPPGSNDNPSWNPTAIKFRSTNFTQVSSRPSFTDRSQVTSVNNLSDSPRIHLVGHQDPQDLRTAALKMYQSLKTLQRAIHLSDSFCFRSLPEETRVAGGAPHFAEPHFLEFIESANEMELFRNIITLLSDSKESIESYLSSIRESHLVPESPSERGVLTKVEKCEGKESEMETQVVMRCPTFSRTESELPSELAKRRAQIVLPEVHTFTEEQVKVTLSSYFTSSRTLIQTVMCDGHRHQIHFAQADRTGPIQGILRAKTEYIGQPSPISLGTILNSAHRCANYIDTRISCSCVWARQSKHYLLEFIEAYLEKGYRPSTDLSWWRLRWMMRKLRKINVFASITTSFTGELVGAVSKMDFCMEKALTLLEKLKEPQIPGFPSTPVDLSSFEEVNLNSDTETSEQQSVVRVKRTGSPWESSSVEDLFCELKRLKGNSSVVEVLLEILASAIKDVESVSALGELYSDSVRVSKKCRRVLRFMSTTSSQLGHSKEVQLGSLIATFLAAVEKISMFEELLCGQGAESRAKVYKLCGKIMGNLHELRNSLCIQQHWATNLAKNSFMRIKEINEIRRLRRMKKSDKHINEKMEFLRGSDRSLRNSVW